MNSQIPRMRLGGLCVLLAIWLSCPIASYAADTRAARDWSAHPAIVEFQTQRDVYALGDVHGDHERLVQLLLASRLIPALPAQPSHTKWSGGESVLVVTGDMIDKYDHSLDVIACFRALQLDALQQGGRVIITMGNHEAEFLASGGKKKKAVSITAQLAETDGKGKKSPTLAAELKAAGIAPADVADGTDPQGVGQFLRDLPIAVKINGWFFCHAGNTHGASLADLRDRLMKGIDADGFGSPILSDGDSMLEARMHPHPWWESAVKSDPAADILRSNLNALGCQHLVIGHQPGEVIFSDGTRRPRDQIFTKFDGLLFMIDTGMSRGVDNGRGAVLHIHSNSASMTASNVEAIFGDGAIQSVWSSSGRKDTR